MIEGRKTSPARVRVIGTGREGTELEFVIHEGRNRQIRRMCEAVGHEVVWLERFVFAGLSVEGMERGTWRNLTTPEIDGLKSLVGLKAAT